MNWGAWFTGALAAFCAGKAVNALRTGEIGMYTGYGAGKTYRRDLEPLSFYRAVVLQSLFTILMTALAVVAFR